MKALQVVFMGICAAVVLIAAAVADAFPTEWNMALFGVAITSLGGVFATAYAMRKQR